MSLPPLFPPPGAGASQTPAATAAPLPEVDFSNISFDYEDDSGDSPKRSASPEPSTALGNFLKKQAPAYGSVKIAKKPTTTSKKRYKKPPAPNQKRQTSQPGDLVIKKRAKKPEKVEIDLKGPAKHISTLFAIFSHHEHMEMEAKMGRFEGNQFVSGVSYDDFMKIHDRLASYKGWSNQDRFMVWVPTFDYMLDNSIRVTKTSSGNNFIKKTTIQHVTYKCPERKYDLRVSMKEELPIKVRLPQEPNMVRVKKRKSFTHRRTWQFDLTIVWTGRDEQEAQSNPPSYEVECEFVGPHANAGPNFDYTAQSLLEKMVDFLGRDEPLSLIKV